VTTGLNFWDAQVWSFVITLTLLLGTMIVANILRNTIAVIRKLMIPSSVLGGFLLLAADFLLERLAGVKLLNAATLEMLTYHGLGLGFVAMALRKIDKKQDKRSKTGAFDAGVTVVATYLIQAVLGLAVSIGFYYLLAASGPPACFCPWATGRVRARPTTGAITMRPPTALQTEPASA
jgi:ESS family glutamate:Na+ symporter